MAEKEQGHYSPDSLASRIGITRRTLDRMMKAGRGPKHLRIGRRIIIRHSAAEEWLDSLEIPSAPVSLELHESLRLPEGVLEGINAYRKQGSR